MSYKGKLLFVVIFVISLLVGARWAKSQTVSVVTNGNITTTTTTTTTPTNTVVTPNVPNYGDQTVVTTNNVQTSIVTTETNKNTGNLLSNNNDELLQYLLNIFFLQF